VSSSSSSSSAAAAAVYFRNHGPQNVKKYTTTQYTTNGNKNSDIDTKILQLIPVSCHIPLFRNQYIIHNIAAINFDRKNKTI